MELDSDVDQIRRHSQRSLIQEIEFAEHLVQHGYIMLKLKAGRCVNLARTLSLYGKGIILIELPMSDPKAAAAAWHRDVDNDNDELEDTWKRWNTFRSHTDFNCKIKLALELTSDIPSEDELNRWLGEPVEYIIISADLFVMNKQNYPVLLKTHQQLLAKFLKFPIRIMVKSNSDDPMLKTYVEYLYYLSSDKFRQFDPMIGFDDLLEIPLQPLYDNLDSYTYEVFEKDPVKYKLYQEAIELALIDIVPEEEILLKSVVIMIVGAGRGPLVRSAINAGKKTKRKVKIYIIEKNPNAVITLKALQKEIWLNEDINLFSCDMRDFNPPEKADILVSELLGSFGDNELSPECLDGAQDHIKPTGISIPSSSTSFLNPVMSSKLFNATRALDRMFHPRDKNAAIVSSFENTYVVYPKNVYHIADPKELFTFEHPNHTKPIDNSRFKTLQFQSNLDCVLHGFIGYFEAILYKNVTISIHPFTHTIGLSSWFSFFLPISEPQQVPAGKTIEANFWRCTASHKVWYEWNISKPNITHIHNHNGRVCPIYK